LFTLKQFVHVPIADASRDHISGFKLRDIHQNFRSFYVVVALSRLSGMNAIWNSVSQSGQNCPLGGDFDEQGGESAQRLIDY